MYMYVCMKNYKICLIVVENVCHDNDLYSTNIVFQYFKRRGYRMQSPCGSKGIRLTTCILKRGND